MRFTHIILGVYLLVITSCAVSKPSVGDDKKEETQLPLIILLEVNATQQSVDKATNICNGVKAYKTCQVEQDNGAKLILKIVYDRVSVSEKKQLSVELATVKEVRVIQMSEQSH